jgi:hypothetical protein
LMSGFCIGTSASFSDSPTVSINNTADIWIVPSISPSAPDFQSAKVNWTQTGSYAAYTLQYSTTSNFGSVTSVAVNGLTTTISGLTSNTTYYFRVRPTASPTGTWKTTNILIPSWTPATVGTGWSGYIPSAQVI